MVDDDVVNTVEGENSLKSRLEKMGVEIVLFDESNVTQGDIIFYDGEQTYQHVLVADHMDEQGNWRVFGNSSSANKIMEQPLYQGQTPAWIAKVSTLNGATNVQTQRKEKLRRRSRPSRSSTSTRKIRRRKNFWNSSPRKDFLKPSTTPTSNPSIFSTVCSTTKINSKTRPKIETLSLLATATNSKLGRQIKISKRKNHNKIIRSTTAFRLSKQST